MTTTAKDRTLPPDCPDRKVCILKMPTPERTVYSVLLTVAGETSLWDVQQGLVNDLYPVWIWTQTQPLERQGPLTVDLGVFGCFCSCHDHGTFSSCAHVEASQALTEAGQLPDLNKE